MKIQISSRKNGVLLNGHSVFSILFVRFSKDSTGSMVDTADNNKGMVGNNQIPGLESIVHQLLSRLKSLIQSLVYRNQNQVCRIQSLVYQNQSLVCRIQIRGVFVDH